MSEQEVLDHIIIGYQKVITERYQYHHIQENYYLPSYFDETLLDKFRGFFLEYIYRFQRKSRFSEKE